MTEPHDASSDTPTIRASVGMDMVRYRCTGNRSPIDERAWLRWGCITDTDGIQYTDNGHPYTNLDGHLDPIKEVIYV